MFDVVCLPDCLLLFFFVFFLMSGAPICGCVHSKTIVAFSFVILTFFKPAECMMIPIVWKTNRHTHSQK